MDKLLDTKSLDKLFSPSYWSKRFSTPEQVESEHVAFAKIESEQVRKTIPFETVQYGETFTNETFDIYGIDLPKDAPIFIYIHGGYWQLLDKSVSAYVVRPLVCAGIKVIVLDYDLCPNISLEQLVDQVQRAGIFIVNYAVTIGTKGIQLAGHSAGAHLAVCLVDYLVYQSHPHLSLVKSCYLIAGVYDLSELRFTMTANANNILSLNDDNTLKLSPIHFQYDKWPITASDCLFIRLFIGTSDAPKLLEHSRQLEEILRLKGCHKHCLILLDGYDHFNIVEELAQANFAITKTIIDEAKLFLNHNKCTI